MDQTGIIAIAVFAGLVALWLIFYFIPVGLWFSALVSGVRISLLQLILMRLLKFELLIFRIFLLCRFIGKRMLYGFLEDIVRQSFVLW